MWKGRNFKHFSITENTGHGIQHTERTGRKTLSLVSLLLACRRLIRNQCRGFRLGVHLRSSHSTQDGSTDLQAWRGRQGHSETRGMLIFDGDRKILGKRPTGKRLEASRSRFLLCRHGAVHAWSQGGRDVFGDLAASRLHVSNGKASLASLQAGLEDGAQLILFPSLIARTKQAREMRRRTTLTQTAPAEIT